MNSRKQLGKNLKKVRLEKGLKQADLAKKADISANYYAKIERGEINTTYDKLEKIFEALGVTSTDVMPI